MRGASSLVWEQFSKVLNKWIKIEDYQRIYNFYGYPTFEENQTLVVLEAEGITGRQDDTEYRCIGRDSRKSAVLRHTVRLEFTCKWIQVWPLSENESHKTVTPLYRTLLHEE